MLDDPTLPLRKKCLKTLCKICGNQELLPSSLQIPIRYDPSGRALYSGGYADVWKGLHQDYSVAIKVLRVYSTSDFDKIKSVSCECTIQHYAGELTFTCPEILQGSRNVGNAPPSQRVAALGSDNDRPQICNDIKVDDEREHQRVSREAQGCG